MLDHAQSFLVPAPSAQLQVRVAGAGPAVVLLPGMGRPSSDLDPLATRLVEAGYRVLLPQPRGLSPSTGRLDGLTFHDFAADIACVIEHVCADKGAPVVVIGHAIGNRIARTLAADRPDLVRLVVLLTSSGRVQPAPDIAAAMRIGLAADSTPEERRRVAALAWFGPGRDPTPWVHGWSHELIAAFHQAAAATDVADFWTAGRAPVLIVQGLADVCAPVENGRMLKRELGDRATLVELPGIGHAMPVEDPDAVADVIVRHLEEASPQPGKEKQGDEPMPMLTRRTLLAATSLAAMPLAPSRAAGPSGTITIAEIFDPPGLDPTVNSVDLVSTITENVFDTLYAFDKDWKPAPVLAAGPADMGEGGTVVTIPLRTGVTFHDGSAMTSADVAASLRRWLKLSSRGQLAAPLVTEIAEPAPDRLVIKLKQPFLPLLPLLAFNSATAIILPKAKAEAAMGGPFTRIEDLVGTGPFKLADRRPDQYTRLTRFEGYVPSPNPPSGYAGARKPGSDTLSFVPVPNVNTRLQGLLSGQYDVADGLSTDSYAQIEKAPGLVPVITKPGGWLFMVMNTKQGLTANPQIRQAAQAALDNEAIMLAAMGAPRFFELGSSLFPDWSPYRSNAGANLYNQKDPAKAKKLLAEAGYKGEPFRILTSQQYDYVYKAALVAMQNLQDAGFKVDLQLMDWASVMSRRFDAGIWESFVTFHGFVPDPALITILSPGYPGWWDTPAKRAALETFNAATDETSRAAAWGKLQDLLMQEAPTVQLGKYFGLLAHQKNVSGVPDLPITPFWAAAKA